MLGALAQKVSLFCVRPGKEDVNMKQAKPIWQKSRAELFQDFACSQEGLSSQEASRRLEQYGPNEPQAG